MRTRNQFGWALARRLPITAVLMVALACAGAGERSAAQVPGVTTSTMQGNLDALSQENVHDRGNGSLYPASGTFKLKGEIEVVTRDAVWVRRSDGSLFEALLPSQGDLRSQALAHSYHVGDEVELEAEFIPPQFVTADGHFFQLRLRQLRFRGHGAGRSLAAALRSPAWRAADNLLPLPAGTPAAKPEPAPQPGDAVDAFLAATRQAERRSLAELPNFLVTETITRTAQVASSEVTDRIESELAVASGRERRSAI